VFFTTKEPITSDDTDMEYDVFERDQAGTARVSYGPNGGNGMFGATAVDTNTPGTAIVFSTAEKLFGTDADIQPDLFGWELTIRSLEPVGGGSGGAGGGAGAGAGAPGGGPGTGAGAGAGAGAPGAAAFGATSFTVTDKIFRVGSAATPIRGVAAKTPDAPVGTMFEYTLTAPGTAVIRIRKVLPGASSRRSR
jgi:hypothetical protein